MPRTSKTTTKKATARTTEAIATTPTKKETSFKYGEVHTVDLFHAGEKITFTLNRKKARALALAVVQRNIQALPLTVVDDNGIAHTFRSIDRASFPASVINPDDRILSI